MANEMNNETRKQKINKNDNKYVELRKSLALPTSTPLPTAQTTFGQFWTYSDDSNTNKEHRASRNDMNI